MVKYLQLVTGLFFIVSLNAQDFDWASQFSGDNYGQGLNITSDMDGNVISTGVFIGACDFDPGVGMEEFTAVSEDIYITKQDENGVLLWAKQLGSIGSEVAWSIVTDNVGDIFLTGSFQGSVDFDPGAGEETITAVGAQDIFILKLSASGDFQWVKTMGSADSENGQTIEIDASNNIIVTGIINNGTVDMDPGVATFNLTGNYDSFILKLNASGDFVWAKQMVNPTDIVFISGCKIDDADNIYTTGYFKATTNFNTSGGTDNLTSFGNRDAFVCKTNSAGDLVWAKQIGGSDADAGFDLDFDASGNVFLSGVFSGTADFDPNAGTETINSAGGYDIYACKLDPSGNYIWASGFGGTAYDEGTDIAVNSVGIPYIIGGFSGTADFDPGAGTNNLTSAGLNDAFIIQLNADGSLNTVDQIGGTGNDWAQTISLDPLGNVAISGWFSGTADLDPSVGTETYTAAGMHDPFVIRLKRNDAGIFDVNANSSDLSVFPNPTKANVAIQTTEIIESIAIYSLTGEIVQVENLSENGQGTKMFSIEHLAAGVYLLHIKTENNTSVVQLIKE